MAAANWNLNGCLEEGSSRIGIWSSDHHRMWIKGTQSFDPTGNPRGIWGVWRGTTAIFALWGCPVQVWEVLELPFPLWNCCVPRQGLLSHFNPGEMEQTQKLQAMENWDCPAALGGPNCDLPGPEGNARMMERDHSQRTGHRAWLQTGKVEIWVGYWGGIPGCEVGREWEINSGD